MNPIARSPTNAGGSAPDLTMLSDMESQKMTLRKRKVTQQAGMDCDCVKNMADLRNDIMSMLKVFTISQNEHMTSMRDDISQIKNQMDNIRSTTDYLVTEHCKILTDINDLKNQKVMSEQRIKTLENDVNALKIDTCPMEPISSLPTNSREDLIREISERSNREKNIIIIGVAESHGSEGEDRRLYDESEALRVIKETTKYAPITVKTSRIGKYKPETDRPMKVYLESHVLAKEILRNKYKITNKTIKVFSDQTPAQQQHMKELKKELIRRHENGETGLTIKYIKGYPKIVSSSKN